MAARNETRQSDLTPARIWLQAAVGLVMALGAGVLIHLLWVHEGLPDQAPAQYWPGSGLPQGLSLLAPAALAACAVLPTALLALMFQFWPGDNAPRPRTALTLDAASYLFLPVVVLTPVLWRPMGNGFLAFSLFFLILLTIKAVLVFRVLAVGFLAKGSNQAGFKRHLFIFITALVFLGMAAGWTTLTNLPDARETSLLVKTRRLMPGQAPDQAIGEEPIQADEGRDSVSPWGARPGLGEDRGGYSGNGYYEELIAPLLVLTGRHGVIAFQAGLAAVLAVLLSVLAVRAGAPYSIAAAAAGLSLAGLPFLRLIIEAGPEILAAVFAACGLLLIQYQGKRPWAAAFSLLGAGLFLAACGLGFSLPAAALLGMGAFASLKRQNPGGKSVAWLLGIGALAVMAPLLWHWFNPGPAASSPSPGGVWPPDLGFLWKTPLTSPILLLALAGVIGRIKRHSWLMATGLAMTAASLIHPLTGGPSLFCEGFRAFCALLLPMCALGLALALAALYRPWHRVLAVGPVAWTLAVSWLAVSSPYILWNSSDGAGAKLLFRDLAAALAKLTGETGVPAWAGWLALLAMAGLILWLVRQIKKSPPESPRPESRPWTGQEAMALVLGLAVTILVSMLVFLIH